MVGRDVSVPQEKQSPPPWWLLLLPASFLVHIAEEWWAGEGFPAWAARVAGSPISPLRYLLINGVAWPLFALLTVLGILRPRWAWFPTAFATMVVINAGLHALGTLATRAYSPGLASGLLLYLPIGFAALSHGRRVLDPNTYAVAVLAGFLLHGAVIVLAFV
jgi:hypothetical protein